MTVRLAIRTLAMVLFVCGMAMPAVVQAQLGNALLGSKLDSSGSNGKYRKNNVIRVETSIGREQSVREAFQSAMRRIAEMAQDKGYERIGMTKQNCGTVMMYGIPVYHNCRILAQMVRDSEVAKPEGKHPVHYYRVSSILEGRIVPEGEDSVWIVRQSVKSAEGEPISP